jgi:hypothetical protein
MSSTYSSNLRVELIGSGDQAGTWGTTTDNNFNYIFDAAIAGAISVTIAGTPQALTAVQGPTPSSALNQSVYATLKLVSAASAFTLYAPPASKQYIVWNATSYTATIGNATALGGTTSTGGATITLAAGDKALVWSDGTNFYKVAAGTVTSVDMTVPSFLSVSGNPITTSGTLAVSLSGTALPIANGGTGATTLAGYGALVMNSAGTAATSVAPGTAGNILTSNGTAWASTTPSSTFPSGTLMLFQQTSAPTGWTKQTTHNDKALRVVSGSASSGGSTAFSTVFTNQTPTITTSGLSAGATTLTTAQIPSHTHDLKGGAAQTYGTVGLYRNTIFDYTMVTEAAGGGGSHTHSISGSATSSAITLNVQYVDLIIASKD